MKIICKSGNTNDVEILSNTGKNLLDELSITNIKIIMNPNECVHAILEVTNVELDLKNLEVELNKRVES